MLRERVVSAVLMLAGFVLVNFFLPQWLFQLCLSVVAAIAAWEWSRLCGIREPIHQWLCAGVQFLLTLMLWFVLPLAALAPAASLLGLVWWFAIFCLLVMQPVRSGSTQRADPALLLTGFALLSLCVLFISLLHDSNFGGGPWLLVYALAVVWVMDIGAYFSGKRFGKRKLAVLISPGKTWEGVIGGVVCASLLVMLVLVLVALARERSLAFVLGTILAACFSVVGDLYESRLKRAAGMKDSSQLIRGHGGVLDRIDGVIAAMPVFGFAWIWLG